MELSNSTQKNKYETPHKMSVIVKENISYSSYWNEKTQNWGGLLDATIYNDEVPSVKDGKEADYREIIGIK